MKAADYKPAHGGFPGRRRVFRKLKLSHGVTVNASLPPEPGFNPGLVHEAYEMGRRDGRSGR